MNDKNIKPSRLYYFLAIIVFVVGCSIFAFYLFKNLGGLVENLTRVIVPGGADLTLSEPGTYTIFYEYQTVIDDEFYSTGETQSGLECSITYKASGAKIPLSSSSKNVEYSFGGRKGISVLEFTIEKGGVYQFSGRHPEGQSEIVLAIGRGFLDKLVGTIVVGMLIFLVSAAVGVAIALMIFFRRQEAMKRG